MVFSSLANQKSRRQLLTVALQPLPCLPRLRLQLSPLCHPQSSLSHQGARPRHEVEASYHPVRPSQLLAFHINHQARPKRPFQRPVVDPSQCHGLESYFLPGDLEAHIADFVGHCNPQRYHESLNNVTPADVYTGRGNTILLEREKTKRRTMKLRRLQHAKSAA